MIAAGCWSASTSPAAPGPGAAGGPRPARRPLREHLAAVLAIEARYDPRQDLLVDPMCGAGTIAIEAALAARGAPVIGTAPALWPDTRPVIVAGDHDLEVLAVARANAARARSHADLGTWGFRAIEP
jgi:23S rRNA G2445 N2-methylase RlmL